MKKIVTADNIQLNDIYKTYNTLHLKNVLLAKSGVMVKESFYLQEIYRAMKSRDRLLLISTLKRMTQKDKIEVFKGFKFVFPFLTHKFILEFCHRELVRLKNRDARSYNSYYAENCKNKRIIFREKLYEDFVCSAFMKYGDSKGIIITEGSNIVIKNTLWLKATIQRTRLGAFVYPPDALNFFNKDKTEFLFLQIFLPSEYMLFFAPGSYSHFHNHVEIEHQLKNPTTKTQTYESFSNSNESYSNESYSDFNERSV